MKIGLIRHFKVKYAYPDKIWITPSELTSWFAAYDASDIEEGTADLQEVNWEKCYSSDMYRAEKTASTLFQGEIIKTAKLREVPAYPVFQKNIRLPFHLWAILVRLAWLVNHPSQKEAKKAVEKRINEFLDDVIAAGDENILIVSHGALMIFMRKELRKRGFNGPRLGSPVNGKLYLFEN